MSLFFIMIVLVGGLGFYVDQRHHDQVLDAQQKMAQNALASGSISDYQASDEYTSAMKLLQGGSYQGALIYLNSATTVKETDPRFFDARSKAKEGLGDHAGAEKDTQQAAQLRSAILEAEAARQPRVKVRL